MLAGPDNNPRGAWRSRYLWWDAVGPCEGTRDSYFCLKANSYQVLGTVEGRCGMCVPEEQKNDT